MKEGRKGLVEIMDDGKDRLGDDLSSWIISTKTTKRGGEDMECCNQEEVERRFGGGWIIYCKNCGKILYNSRRRRGDEK